MAKLWGGRFEGGLDPLAKDYSYSLSFDQRLLPFDIKVNQAHAAALEKAGYLTTQEHRDIHDCLGQLLVDYQQDAASVLADDEDIHSCVERVVTEKLGDLGKKLHTGKSRNDQVVTDMRLFIKEASLDLVNHLDQLIQTFYQLACEYQDVIFPGFTHFQQAQPVLFSHHLLAYISQFTRDQVRFKAVFDQADVCSLGSGALAGNNYGLDRAFMAERLGFSAVSQNSLDAVSDRDFMLDFCFAGSQCMLHMSRVCEELVLWSSSLINFVQIGDAFTTGSSIMPQKKNPDIAELIRGKSARLVGQVASLQHLVKALPLAYNRDFQEDKLYCFDAYDTVLSSLACLAKMIPSLSLNQAVIAAALERDYSLATELADYLVKKGLPFRDCHEITGKIVLFAIEKKKGLADLSMNQYHSFSNLIEEDVYEALTLKAAVKAKDGIGGTSFEQVEYQLNKIAEEKKWNKV